MKEKIFGIDTPFFKLMSMIGDLMLLNLMWIVFSIPIITIGASTTALLYTGMKLSKGRDGYVISNFWKSFKLNLKQSTVIWLILLLFGGALGYAGWYWMSGEDGISRILAVLAIGLAILYLIELMFVFAVQAKFSNTILNTMKNALIMGIQNFPITILCIVGVGLLVGLNYTFFVANILTLVIGIGALGWVLGMLYNLAFRKYLPKEEIRKDDEWHIPDETEDVEEEDNILDSENE